MTNQAQVMERKLTTGLGLAPVSQTFVLQVDDFNEQLNIFLENTFGRRTSIRLLSEDNSGGMLAKVLTPADEQLLKDSFSVNDLQKFASELIAKLFDITEELLGNVEYNQGSGTVQIQILNKPSQRFFICIRDQDYRALYKQIHGEDACCDYMIRVEPQDAPGTHQDLFEHDLLEITAGEFEHLLSLKGLNKSFEKRADEIMNHYIGNERIRYVVYLGRDNNFRDVYVRSPLLAKGERNIEVYSEYAGGIVECLPALLLEIDVDNYNSLQDVAMRYGRHHSMYDKAADEIIDCLMMTGETVYFSTDCHEVRRYTKSDLKSAIEESTLMLALDLPAGHPAYEHGVNAVISYISERARGKSPSVFLASLREPTAQMTLATHVKAHLEITGKWSPSTEQVLLLKQMAEAVSLVANEIRNDEQLEAWIQDSGITNNFARCMSEVAQSIATAIPD
jgi:hypothetical protein